MAGSRRCPCRSPNIARSAGRSVISPLARDADDVAGAGLNVNGDDAAAALAAATGADELVLVADVPGVLDAGAVIPEIDATMAQRLISRGVAAGGMAAKLDAALTAFFPRHFPPEG